MIGFELEVLAKKLDRFGWDRDRGTAAHDRILMDWMDALQDFPLAEVRAACRAWVVDNPRRMPNEGDIRAEIIKGRGVQIRAYRAALPPVEEPTRPRMSDERRKEILAEFGIADGETVAIKRVGGEK